MTREGKRSCNSADSLDTDRTDVTVSGQPPSLLTTGIQRWARSGLDLVNSGLARVDPLFAAAADPASPAPLFIVGPPRSGTTLAYQVIAQQFRVAYFTAIMGYLYGMPNLVARSLRPWLKRPRPTFESRYGNIRGFLAPSEHANFWFRWFPRQGPQGHYVAPEGLDTSAFDGLQQAVASISAIVHKPFVFKCVYLSMCASALAQIFPHARFIHVRRDRMMTCQSLYLARRNRSRPGDWWSIKPPNVDTLRTAPLWYQVAEQICQTERILSAELPVYAPGRLMQLHYEDLCQHPRKVVAKLAGWLPLPDYQSYDDARIPDSFPLSNRLVLPKDITKKIQQRLRELDGDNSE
ncbi:MAG: sulfotransferase [Gammaproteobacteria bacterium]|nr:sulfotransferase [Gammaproteobacteria bacterium]MCI0590361.1 sulfotransferase [Gammaproteobacteria bacterium]